MRVLLLHNEEGQIALTAVVGESVHGSLGLKTQGELLASEVEIPELKGLELENPGLRDITDRMKANYRVDANSLRPKLKRRADAPG